MASKRAGIGGRPQRVKEVTVRAIDPDRYPQFLGDQEHPCFGRSETGRIRALIDICGRVYAQNLVEAGREAEKPSKKPKAA